MIARLIRGPTTALSLRLLTKPTHLRCLTYSTVQVQNTRQLSTTQFRLQDNKKKDDDDKNKNKKEFKKEFNMELTGGQIGLGLLIALLVVPRILESNRSADRRTIEFPEFLDLAKNNKISALRHHKESKILEIDCRDGTKVKTSGVEYDLCRARLEQVYDSIQLHPANRLVITKDTSFNPGDISRTLSDIIFSPTMLLIGFFSLIYFPNVRNKLTKMMKPGDMMNQAKNQGKEATKGKKGKKKQDDGGFFGNMPGMAAQNKKIGELIDPSDIKVDFGDVAGCEEAKIEVIEIVDFLKNEKKYKAMGAKVPKGAILHGPPGTGKTLLAKACAKEAGVNFVACNGSEFVEMFVGLGAKRVREMFDMARDNAPCILFIDEIDAVGKKRGRGMGGGNQEADQTINAFLAEMDGFNTDEPVVVMAATNQVDTLDDALTRPGRFDRKIYVGLPDVKGRSSIFKVHLERVKTELERAVLAKELATKTPGMSGADIDNVVNEAALNAVRYGDESVMMVNFERAIDRVIAGMEKKNDIMDPDTKRRVALHEAGHATVAWFLKNCAPLVKVTIVPRTSGALGFAMYQPMDNVLQTQEHFQDQMCMALGGRAAEELFYDGVVSSGAHDDLKKVGGIAYMMTARLGMTEKLYNQNIEDIFQQINQGGMRSSYPSESTKQLIDSEIKDLIDAQYKRTLELLTDKKADVEALADALLQHETIGRDQVVAVLGPRPHKEKFTYEEQVAGTKQKEEDLSLPPGLAHWEKSFRNSDKFAPAKQKKEEQAKKDQFKQKVVLPNGWVKKHHPASGDYYLNETQKTSTLRHPGIPLPDGWTSKIDNEGREKYYHEETGYESWLLEEDENLPKNLKDELKKK